MPRPVKGRSRGPKTRFQWQIRSIGYFDRQSKNYEIIESARSVAPVTRGNTVSYPDILTGIDVRFISQATRLKEELVLSQSARDKLPAPSKFGIAADDAFLMFQVEFKLTPNNIKVFARKPDKSKADVKRGNDFDFEGSDRIEFEDENEVLHFFFPIDYAFVEGDPERKVVHRFFYSERGKNFLLVGVPFSWVSQAPAGNLIIDPTITAATTADTYLQSISNHGSDTYLAVGRDDILQKARTLIKFDLSNVALPSDAEILGAQMNLKYSSIVGSGAWVDRLVMAHQMLVDWNEDQATKDFRLTSVPWDTGCVAINNRDANDKAESVVLLSNDSPRWVSWDLTDLTSAWLGTSAANYGVILFADNDDTFGYELRFNSSEATFDKPYLQIIWTQPTKTVYFLKDHLGSVRATVDDIGQVVGYDDYDPWGLVMAGRSMTTGTSTVDGAAKNKFTGKELDDELGLDWNYFEARYYGPDEGLWWSMDPTEEFSSPYVYVGDNPINSIDPFGLTTFFVDGRQVHDDGISNGLEVHTTNAVIERHSYGQVTVWDRVRKDPDSRRVVVDPMAFSGAEGFLALVGAIFRGETSDDREMFANTPFDALPFWISIGGFSPLKGYRNALQLFKTSQFTKVGRALTKHPNIVGAKNFKELMRIYGNQTGVNGAAGEALKDIMRNGTRTIKDTKNLAR